MQYAGTFLLLGDALNWLTTARACFADAFGTLTPGLLISIFALVVGLERMYHLDEMEDPGFALLTGGRRCPSRFRVAPGGGTCPGTRWPPAARPGCGRR